MDVLLQAILLVLTISFAIGARLTSFGWFFFIGIGSILILGLAHFIIHFSRMNSLAVHGRKYQLLILASHILFLNMFLFQVDIGDNREYIIIDEILRIPTTGLTGLSWGIVGISGFFYLMVIGEIYELPKETNAKDSNDNILMMSIFLILILTIVFTIVL